MKNIKQSLLDFLKFRSYTPKSIKCARIIVDNTRKIDLKVNYTEKELNTFMRKLDFNVSELNIEVIRAYIWMDNGHFIEIQHDSFDIGRWKLVIIPQIPQDLIA